MKFKVTAVQVEGDDGLAVTLRGLNTDQTQDMVVEQIIARGKGPVMERMRGFQPHQIIDAPIKPPA